MPSQSNIVSRDAFRIKPVTGAHRTVSPSQRKFIYRDTSQHTAKGGFVPPKRLARVKAVTKNIPGSGGVSLRDSNARQPERALAFWNDRRMATSSQADRMVGETLLLPIALIVAGFPRTATKRRVDKPLNDIRRDLCGSTFVRPGDRVSDPNDWGEASSFHHKLAAEEGHS